MPPQWTLLIAIHAIAAAFSILFGAFQLVRRTKGGAIHRTIGRVWVFAMYVVTLTSFGVQTLNGGFTWLHGLAVFTLFTVSVGLWAARTRRIQAHRSFMKGSYFGVLGAFVGVVVVPERRIPQMAIHDLAGLALWTAAIVLTAFFTVLGFSRLSAKTKDVSHRPHTPNVVDSTADS
ncbi:DUF2306 domain-containing protein [Arthrobacter sulfonylureivorans]|uniref:DUF2306 domain-containing protein n=1 Tax=Arthrobacter sulfonylureivorans TaxID=2486855 RepID=A0ABY3WCE9_9MICC|nr:DUF2306 domain-containing protein [Arthrobacter sulfonylureivorans]UNK45394.1 DUF2306 domain-containing protein [Arthrobacter sulfonylureivorans]